MTDATVLADALVEAGILKLSIHSDSEYRYLFNQVGCTAAHIITDWRVAGKVLESLMAQGHGIDITDTCVYITSDGTAAADTLGKGKGESLPRAIIEAWYEARQ